MDILSRKKVQVMTPEKTNILLFGGGNFVRAFIGSIFQTYNEVLDQNLGITVVKVTPGKYIDWIAQDGLYHVNTKGIKNGVLVEETQLISCVREVLSCYDQWREFLNTAGNPDIEYIISNTTESGLRYKEEVFSEQRVPDEFPSKLTIWLYERFKILGNNSSSGVTLIPCELLEDNGTLLKNLILQYAELWTIDPAFKNWLNSACHFCNTLVDRIVPGASQTSKANTFDALGYIDNLLTEGEPYHFFAIEAPEKVQKALPIDKIGLNIIYTNDLAPYRLRKVRMLNGAHSSMVPVGLLGGCKTVGDVMESKAVENYVQSVIFQEIIPALSLPEEGLQTYANDILDRFRNPFIKHQLMSIALNSFSKFKARILPSIKDYVAKFGECPDGLCLAYAAMIYLYRGEINNGKIELKDDVYVLSSLQHIWSQYGAGAISLEDLNLKIAQDLELWGEDLSKLPAFLDKTNAFLSKIANGEIHQVLDDFGLND